VTLEELDRWLDVYGRAWERKDVNAFVSCFAEDAVYYWGPWAAPLRGHDVIRAATERAIADQDDIRFSDEPLAITPDGRGIARWWVSTKIPGEDTVEENEGIFLVTLNAEGKCTEFREWFNSRTRPAKAD
jgi:hypothetical protein